MSDTPASCNKNAYPSKKVAQTAANYLTKHKISGRRARGRVQKRRVYHCPDCHQWHLTADIRRH
jgi:hypothetical protein